MKFVAIDFETANSNRQSACSIGIAVVENFEVVKTFSRLIKPTPNYYDPYNTYIHNISQEMTDSAPTFAELWPEIKPYLENQTVIAHNASFDFSVLRYVLGEYGIDFPELNYYCTMLIGKKAYPGMFNYQLSTICRKIGFNLNHHEAESDAEGCARIMIDIFREAEAETFEQLENELKFKGGKLHSGGYKAFKSNTAAAGRSSSKTVEINGDPSKFDEDHTFYGKNVVFTGTLERMPRNEARQLVADLGGLVASDSLTAKTNFLVVGSQDFTRYGEGFKSSKMKKAEAFIEKGKELEIISEDDFYGMV